MLPNTIRIRLDGGNNQVFRSGSRVSGTVEYFAGGGARLRCVTIDFRGVTKVDPGRHSKRKTEFIELFHMQQTLHSTFVWTPISKTFKWHFEFTFPLFTGPDRSGKYVDSDNPLFDETAHVLPPTLNNSQSSETKIEFPLYAIAAPSISLDARPAVSSIASLNFCPDIPQSEESPPPQLLTKPLHLPESTQRRFSLTSLRRPSTASVSSAGMPANNLEITAVIPSCLVIGGTAAVSFTVREATSQPFQASLAHKSTAFHLESLTHRRTSTEPHNPLFGTERRKQQVSRRPGSGGFSVGASVPLLLPTQETGLPPSFKSYGVSREYKLHLKLGIACDGKTHEVKFEAPVELKAVTAAEEWMERQLSINELPPPPPPPGAGPDLTSEEQEELPSYTRYA